MQAHIRRQPHAAASEPACADSRSTELRALLCYAELPAGCILHPVTDATVAPHLRPGEFAIIDASDRVPVDGELFLVAWTASGADRCERRALCQAHWRDGAWSVGSLRRHRSREEVVRLIRSDNWPDLGWVNGPYRAGALEQQLRGRVVGILAPVFEEAKRLPLATGGAA